MKKALSLVVVVMTAALVFWAASSLSFLSGWVGADSLVVVEVHARLPELSESAAQSSPDPAPNQDDNSTVSVASGGPVKASFTVVSGPVGDQEEEGTPSASNAGHDPNNASSTAPARVVSGLAVADQPMQDEQISTATDVRPKSGGLAMGWVFVLGLWSIGTAALGGAFLRFRTKG